MPGATANGYPYPLPGDPVANGASDIQALAQAVDRPAYASRSRQTALTIATSTDTPMLWDTAELSSPGITYNVTTGIFTIGVAGRYLINTALTYAIAATDSYRQIRIYRNGAIHSYRQDPCSTTQIHSVVLSTMLALAASDTVQIVARNSGAGTLTVVPPYRINTVDIARLSP